MRGPRRERRLSASSGGVRADGEDVVVENVGYVVAGLALHVLGSQWLVSGAVYFAKWFGVIEVVASLTIVAAGTSLPEFAARWY